MNKKSTTQSARALVALLVCGAACSIVTATLPTTAGKLAYIRVETPARVAHPATAGLTFAERVSYEQAIEDVYWRHRIWPKERPDPKPSLDAVMTQTQLEKKVADYLHNSQALEDSWQRPITAEELQAEMERMAQHTKQPDVLRELFAALGNDPFVIAECLARPTLSERSLMNWHSYDQIIDRELTQSAGADLRAHPVLVGWERGRGNSSPPKADNRQPITMAPQSANYTLPAITNTGECTDNTWTPTSNTNAPTGRFIHTAVWTGSEMIVWGGTNRTNAFNTGGRYNPSTDSWTATSTVNAPSRRYQHTAIWTGKEMIVWGGVDQNYNRFNTGGRYNPTTDSWTATNAAGAPVRRSSHTAVWTGSEMIVWGGSGIGGPFVDSGGRYNPNTDSWTPTSTMNAPTARYVHTAVWTGSEMIVWGGSTEPGPTASNTGGRYNPGTNSWTATSTINAPRPRISHTAVWIGNEMIVWGGYNGVNHLNTGGKYNPNTDTWAATTTTNAPAARDFHTAVCVGSEMIVWGGEGQNYNSVNTGGRYNASANSWTATATINAPAPRKEHTAVWTGTEMMVWGGWDGGSTYFNTGGKYCAPGPSSQLGNISTRAFVQTADNVMIGGVIVQGTTPKRVIIRAIGPELGVPPYNIPNALADPTLELYDGTGALIASNDNWQHSIIGGIISSSQIHDIQSSGHAPMDPRESAIIVDLPGGNYTAIVRGVNNATGVALVEVYDLSSDNSSILGNISTRSFVQTGDNVMIGGFIVQGTGAKRVIIRAIGPELTQYGIPDPLANPRLELHNAAGALIGSNDDWQHTIIGGVITRNQLADIQNSGHAPTDPSESAIIAELQPGNYTAIVRGVNDTTGVGLVEVYDLH
jgi:N-acetylneuraminic acid mutarotase